MKKIHTIAVTGLLLTLCACSTTSWNTLHQSAGLGNVENIKSFIDKGKSVNIPDEDGTTPLMMAVLAKKYENIAFLIKHGANVNAKDNDGYTALMSICTAGTKKDIPIAKLLIDNGAKINTKNNDGTTAKEICKDFGPEIFSALMQ